METKDLIKLEKEFESKTKEYEEYKSHIKRLESQHVKEAKKIIDRLLLEAYSKAEDKEKFLNDVEDYYELILDDYIFPNRNNTIDVQFPRSTYLFKSFVNTSTSFRNFYDFEIGLGDMLGGIHNSKIERFRRDLCKLFFSSFFDLEFEKNGIFSLVVRDFINEMIHYYNNKSDGQFINNSCLHINSSENKHGIKKYIESLNPELVFSNNQEQEETVESISSENSELQQQIAKIRNSHFPDDYKEQLIAELEQGDSQRGDGKTNGRSI